MLMLVMRMLMSVFPFIKEMLLSVDRGNYSKIAVVLTVLLLVMIILNIVETRIVFATIAQRNATVKENVALKAKLEAKPVTGCIAGSDVSIAHVQLLTVITEELRKCNLRLTKE